jgi:hypothetical protein
VGVDVSTEKEGGATKRGGRGREREREREATREKLAVKDEYKSPIALNPKP